MAAEISGPHSRAAEGVRKQGGRERGVRGSERRRGAYSRGRNKNETRCAGVIDPQDTRDRKRDGS